MAGDNRANRAATMVFAGLAATAGAGTPAETLATGPATPSASSAVPTAVAPFASIRTAIQQGLTAFQKQNNFTPGPEDAAMFRALEKRYTQAVQQLPGSPGPLVFGVGITANDGITTMEQWGVKLEKDGSADVIVRPQEMSMEKAQQQPSCVASSLAGGPCFQVFRAARVDAQGRISPLDAASYSLAPFGLRDDQKGIPFKHDVRPAAAPPSPPLSPPAPSLKIPPPKMSV